MQDGDEEARLGSTRSVELCRRREPEFLYEIQVSRIGDLAVVGCPGSLLSRGSSTLRWSRRLSADKATDVFEACRKLGWLNIACTPFGRGWTLDRIVDAEGRAGDAGCRAHVADLMLRYALYSPHVDRLMVAMRKPEWVRPNAESARRGPLSDEERLWLLDHLPKD